jgi:hypothetical protein
MTPEEMVARLLYRDALMLVIDKPAGMAVHRGPKDGESLEDHFDALRFGLPRAPALAHRLDRDTSGCLALGRHRKALAELGRLFKIGSIGKTYWAVVEGGPQADAGRIDLPVGSAWRGAFGWKFFWEFELARPRAADRPHPSAAGPLRRHGLAHRGRSDLRQRFAHGRARRASTRVAAPCPRDRGAALSQARADPGDRAGAAPHGGAAASVRMEGRDTGAGRVAAFLGKCLLRT